MNRKITLALMLSGIILILLLISASGLFLLYPALGIQYLGYSIAITPIITLIILFIILFTPEKAK